MDYAVSYDKEINACVIRVTGKHKRPENSKQLLSIALEAGTKQRCFRFLFDMRKAQIITNSLMDSYEIVNNPTKFGFNLSYTVAAVYSSNMDDHRFMETVGYNRGAMKFRVFDDLKKAKNWLVTIH